MLKCSPVFWRQINQERGKEVKMEKKKRGKEREKEGGRDGGRKEKERKKPGRGGPWEQRVLWCPFTGSAIRDGQCFSFSFSK